MLASLADEQLDQLVTPPREQKCLLVGRHAIHPLLAEFFERIDFGLGGEFGLQKLRLHQLL